VSCPPDCRLPYFWPSSSTPRTNSACRARAVLFSPAGGAVVSRRTLPQKNGSQGRDPRRTSRGPSGCAARRRPASGRAGAAADRGSKLPRVRRPMKVRGREWGQSRPREDESLNAVLFPRCGDRFPGTEAVVDRPTRGGRVLVLHSCSPQGLPKPQYTVVVALQTA
jgi:hypothetical protein